MTPVIGGVTHDPINARRRLEQAWAASAITVTRCHCIHHRRRRWLSSLIAVIAPAATNTAVAFSASAVAVSVELIVANCQRKRHKQHHHQGTNGSTILFTFTFPVNLDLFNLSTVSFGSILANMSYILQVVLLYILGCW
jgi:hypothetical protein